jgi:hypothetical protein
MTAGFGYTLPFRSVCAGPVSPAAESTVTFRAAASRRAYRSEAMLGSFGPWETAGNVTSAEPHICVMTLPTPAALSST